MIKLKCIIGGGGVIHSVKIADEEQFGDTKQLNLKEVNAKT